MAIDDLEIGAGLANITSNSEQDGAIVREAIRYIVYPYLDVLEDPRLFHILPAVVTLLGIKWQHKKVNDDEILLQYAKRMCKQDVSNFCQDDKTIVALTENRSCNLWSVIHPEMKIEEFKMFIFNLIKYHRKHMRVLDQIILSILYSESADDHLGLDEEIALFITVYDKYCMPIFVIMMGFVGKHRLWDSINRRAMSKLYKIVYSIMFPPPFYGQSSLLLP